MAIVKQAVDYTFGSAKLRGYLAFDHGKHGKRPGVLVCHEWWGLNDYIRQRAEQLAQLGYTSFALDMYEQGKTTSSPEEAGKLMNAMFSNPETKGRVNAALDVLKNHASVDANKLGAIGYCMGGALALGMARAGLPLKGVVSFHGSLAGDQPAQPGAVKAKILICHGAEDPMITMDAVAKFDQEMKHAQADYQINVYGGAQHAFTNPNADKTGVNGLKYSAEADRRSWRDMRAFFQEVLA